MKYFLLILGTTLTLNMYAQKNETTVNLVKGQKIIIKTASSQDADMGMGMEMKNFTSSQNVIQVINAIDSVYILTNTLTGLKLSMDFMGQSTDYDSDKKEDSSSDVGKSIKNLNIPDTATLNKYNRKVVFLKKADPVKSEEENPLGSMFENLGNNDANIVSETFFIVPAGKKAGDKWADSTSTKDMKSFTQYQLQSIDKGIATISINGTLENNTQTELQGMQVTVNMTTKSTGEFKVDTKTALVSKRDVKATINGNLEMMGQSLPVTGNVTTSTVYELQ